MEKKSTLHHNSMASLSPGASKGVIVAVKNAHVEYANSTPFDDTAPALSPKGAEANIDD